MCESVMVTANEYLPGHTEAEHIDQTCHITLKMTLLQA